MNKNKQALLHSVVAMLLCISMLIGATFAWFTDSVVSGANVISTGTLKIGLYHTNAAVTSETEVTNETKDLFEVELWEPGVATWENFTVKNEGSLWLKYQLGLNALDVNYVEKNGTRYYLAEVLKAGVVPGGVLDSNADGTITREEAIGQVTDWVALNDVMEKGELAPEGEPDSTIAYGVVIRWEPGANDNNLNVNNGNTTSDGNPLTVDLGVTLAATQQSREEDSFGPDYDTPAEFPELELPVKVTVTVPNDGSVTTEAVTMVGRAVTATVPAGVKLQSGKEALTLTVTEKESSQANITTGATEDLVSLDVHIDGVDAANDKAIIVDLGPVMPKYLNIGNYRLYHVENGATTQMTAVATLAEVDAHNEFYYDLNTGSLTVAMATFSEVALVADTVNPWGGEYDYSWYTDKNSPYSIANADQLAAFGAIVGGMAKDKDGNYIVTNTEDHTDSFKGKTVNLIADINLGDAESENKADLIFYPIGYYNSNKDYKKVSGGSVTSSVSSFEGTFDGQGHTVANFYQNTWEMFGDYNDGYSGTPNHYKDAMGLFGYVYGGTVKNLTVDHFSSDGEFTPTGVIAAYADGNAAFENIAITNCNPRVYNTGNGGIIGIAGDTSAANDDHITLKNITVDNSNKISALWGSWDVACGGLVGMYRGNVDANGNATGDTISFENCHVSAIIDVYNDVCANYQYYAYRYAGMIIGSVRHNTKNAEGKTIPNMTGISATGCTVNYGDWNDYYYCEFEKNTMASYSEDYQFSRVPHSELDFTDANGNGVVDASERASVTGCKHTHTAEENHQAIYLPFHQLFTGYSWGVSSIGLEKYSGIVTDLGITEGDQEESVVKFKVNPDFKELSGNTVEISELFAAVDSPKVPVNDSAVQVAVSAMNNSGITAKYEANADNWTQGTLTFAKIEGMCSVTIQDYNFCKPTTVILQDGKLYSLFNSKFTGDFLYRVGNTGTVSLGTLFAENGIQIEDSAVKVTVSNVTGTASGNYTSNATWENGTIQFSGTGVVKVTIQDETYCNITELNLEVVDAKNATGATNATENNVVLLNDCGFSSLEVSGGYSLYGNGFTMTCASDSVAVDRTYSFVSLKNGTLDNVQIVVPNFSHAILYDSNKKENGNPYSTENGRTRYGNIRSAVIMEGNSKIINSYVSGGRAAVYAVSGKPVIENSTIKGGAAANIHVEQSSDLTLRNITLIQKPTKANVNDPSKTVMGLSVAVVCDSSGNGAPITLEGDLHQYAWAHEGYTQYVPEAGQSAVESALSKTDFIHQIAYEDGTTKDSVNLGFVFMPQEPLGSASANSMNDRRSDAEKTKMPYAVADITGVKIYTYKNTNGTDAGVGTEPGYAPGTQSATLPTISFADVNENRIFTTAYDETKGWTATLKVDVDAGAYTFNFDKLLAQKNGQNLSYTVEKTDGTAVNKDTPITLNTSVTYEYVLKITDNQIYNADGSLSDKSVTHTYRFELLATKTSLPAPTWTSKELNGTPYIVVDSKDGDWNCAVPVLDGLKVKYWSKKQNKEVELDLANVVSAAGLRKGLQNNSNNTITITVADEYTLTVTTTGFKTNDNGKPVVVNDKLYFTVSSSSNYVSTKTTDRTVSISYSFTDANNSEPITLRTSMDVVYATYKSKQYKYSDFCNGTLTEATCVTPDTLITLANGKQVRVDSLKGNEQLMVWNMETGKLDSAPILFVDSETEAEYEIIHLYFSDGTDVKVISEHGFWDYDLNRYVYLDRYADKYIGHTFAKQNGKTLKAVKLTDVVLETEKTTAWSPVTAGHLCYFVNGMLSMPGGVGGLFNIFDVDAETMTYDYAAMAKDIETYGLFTYEELNAIAPLSEDMFNAAGGAYLKISIGKGNLTMDELTYMINRYSRYFG
ncbi:MAG: SipW-dependent-type signal peptide-containing protein [Oscillospiraceae bacterium]|nr:SipW-dependent-type signal peptide-containing protein [Oscillospiraceae bacterium]